MTLKIKKLSVKLKELERKPYLEIPMKIIRSMHQINESAMIITMENQFCSYGKMIWTFTDDHCNIRVTIW